MPYRKLPPKKWPARDEVTKLARAHTVEAMERLIELMESKSEFVKMTAARTVLLQSQLTNLRSIRMGRSKPPPPKAVKVTIRQMKEGEKHGIERGDRGLPVVQRGREGSRDPGDGGDT
jgi:hypothetical protein